MKRTITRCLAGASIALIVAVGTGCDSDEPLANSNATSTTENASVPSFGEIDAALALDSGDEAVVKTALAEWRRGAGANDATRQHFGARHREMAFVAAVAPSLDDDQLEKLVSLIVARRETRREGMRERRGDGNRIEFLARELNLSADQQAAMTRLHEQTRAQVQEQRAAFKNGSITGDELDARLERIRTAAREQMAAILTPEQLAKHNALREQRMEQRRERRMEHAGDRVENRAAWLDAALELTDEQTVRVRTALTTMTETQAAVRAARESGAITREQARDQMGAARDAFEEALATILTAEQQARLAILEPLFPGRLHHA